MDAFGLLLSDFFVECVQAKLVLRVLKMDRSSFRIAALRLTVARIACCV